MAANKLFERGTPLTFLVPSTIISGQPIMPGKTLAAVANENCGAGTATAPGQTGLCSCDLEGVFLLSVVAVTVLSPATGSAVKAGDKIYADTDGTLDATSNVYYGFSLTKNSSGTLFGTAVPGPTISGSSSQLIASGSTATIGVRLKGDAGA